MPGKLNKKELKEEEKFQDTLEKKKSKKKKLIEKKKLTKKQAEEIKIRFAEDSVKHKEGVYDTYLQVLMEYKMPETAYAAIRYGNDFHDLLMKTMEDCRNKEQGFMKIMFGDGKELTELEKLEYKEKYLDKLISAVEGRISMATNDIKLKIAKDSIEKQNAYFSLLDERVKLLRMGKKNG